MFIDIYTDIRKLIFAFLEILRKLYTPKPLSRLITSS